MNTHANMYLLQLRIKKIILLQQRREIPMFDWIGNSRMRKVVTKIGWVFVLSISMVLSASLSFAAIETNRMVSVQMDDTKGYPTLRIVTEEPIGYRYTVYDSDNLTSVVLNFPHMFINAIPSLTDVNQPPVKRVDVSSHDLPWGRMGRVEVVLSEMANYDVAINGNEFVLTLLLKVDQGTTAAVVPASNAAEPVAAPTSKLAEELKPASVVVPAPVKGIMPSASKIMKVDVGAQVVTLQANGLINNYKFFSLNGPERLVVDIYGVKPGFGARDFPLSGDFSGMRVGVYKDKLRFVFDASGKVPSHAVTGNGENVVIRWGAGTSTDLQ